jgi:hypothetical protein
MNTLNEFSAKKIGEVLAFCRVGIETLVKGRNALSPILAVGQTITQIEEQEKTILALVDAHAIGDVTLPKAEKTADKLRVMRDMYVADQWDNPTELLEWLGFFEGAAIVHFGVTAGVSNATKDQVIKDLSAHAIHFHQELLETVRKELEKIGENKTKI